MSDYGKTIRRILADNNCSFVRRGKGDHDIWHSPISNRNVTVNGKIYSRYEAKEVLKQAGIKHKL